MINTQIINLEKGIVELINNSGVNIATVCLILDKVQNIATTALQETVRKENETKEEPQE